jgi:phage terminase large subunit-like protein
MSFSNKHQNERVFATENVTIILATPLKNLSPVMKKMVSLLTAVY